MPFSLALRTIGAGLSLTLAIAVLAVGVARAAQAVRPNDSSASIASMRTLVDHYRSLAWTYERVGRHSKTPTSFSYRRSTDRTYLQWTLDAWMRRAYTAQAGALAALHRRLAVPLPARPGLHAAIGSRLAYSRSLALRLRRIYPGNVSRAFASARASDGPATLRLWQERSAAAALAVALHGTRASSLPPALEAAFLCIHGFEGSWTANTGNGYYGGLQMDLAFQSRYGAEFVARYGTAEHWPAAVQLQVAARAYSSGRGFDPWPNTARACGLV